MVEQVVSIIMATEDADSLVLANKVSFEVKCRYPLQGTYTDVPAALAVLADVVAGDEFANSVSTQEWL
jgi:hypothetical protein